MLGAPRWLGLGQERQRNARNQGNNPAGNPVGAFSGRRRRGELLWQKSADNTADNSGDRRCYRRSCSCTSLSQVSWDRLYVSFLTV